METSKNDMLMRVASTFYEMVRISHRLFHNQEPSSEIKFEIMVYAEYILLIELNRSMKDDYDIFSALTNKYIKEWADENNITNKLPCDYFDFINDRYATYGKELVAISDGSTLPFNIIRNLYEKPLQMRAVDKSQIDFLGSMPRFIEWAESQKSLKRVFQESIVDIKNKHLPAKEMNSVKTIDEIKKLAEQGNSEYQYQLGNAYLLGEGIPKNSTIAADWHEKAANQNHIKAQRSLAYAYKDADGVEQNWEKSMFWFEKAAIQGDANSQMMIGNSYHLGLGVQKDEGKASFYLKAAAKQNEKSAIYLLGLFPELNS